MSETVMGSADLVDAAPDELRERYEVRMVERRRTWHEAWDRAGMLPVHPEDGLVEAHRLAWHEACTLAAEANPAWEPSPLDEALIEAFLISAQLALWSSPHAPGDVNWGDVHVALYRQTRLAHAATPETSDAPLTPLALLLHRSLRVGLPKTVDRVVRRAQEAAESLGMAVHP